MRDRERTSRERRTHVTLHVTKRDGTREPYDADRINRAIERAATGLPDAMAKTMQIAS